MGNEPLENMLDEIGGSIIEDDDENVVTDHEGEEEGEGEGEKNDEAEAKPDDEAEAKPDAEAKTPEDEQSSEGEKEKVEGKQAETETDEVTTVPVGTLAKERQRYQDARDRANASDAKLSMLMEQNERLLAQIANPKSDQTETPKFGPTTVAELDLEPEDVLTVAQTQELENNRAAKATHDAKVTAVNADKAAMDQVARILSVEKQGDGLDFNTVITVDNISNLTIRQKNELGLISDPQQQYLKAYELVVEQTPHLKKLRDERTQANEEDTTHPTQKPNQRTKPNAAKPTNAAATTPDDDDDAGDDKPLSAYFEHGSNLADELMAQ